MADKIEHALQNPKIRLSAPNPQSKGKYASLQIDIWNNNPRVQVNTNDPNFASADRQFGRITGAMETPTFYAMLGFIDQAIVAEPGWKANIQVLSNPKGQSGPGVDPVPSADIWIGKDAEGVVFISVVNKLSEGWPVIKFPFGAPDRRFVKVFHANGSEYTKAEISIQYAKAFREAFATLMGGVLVKTYVKPEPFIPGNKGGGGYNRGGGGGGYNNGGNRGGNGGGGGASSGDGDDLPF